MKYSKIISLLILFTSSKIAFAQTTNCGITYSYDNSGNRVLREVPTCGEGGGLGGSGKRDLSSTDSIQNLTEALYPNPALGTTSIVFSSAVTDAQITITDNLGRQVLSTSACGCTIPLNMGHYPDGLYHVLVRVNGQSFRNEVVKE